MKRRKPKVVTVVWEDHHERDGQGDVTEAEALKPFVWESTGYLVQENETMVELVRDISHDPAVPDIGASMRIMKKCILSRSDQRKSYCTKAI